jgi:hypothetical protein
MTASVPPGRGFHLYPQAIDHLALGSRAAAREQTLQALVDAVELAAEEGALEALELDVEAKVVLVVPRRFVQPTDVRAAGFARGRSVGMSCSQASWPDCVCRARRPAGVRARSIRRDVLRPGLVDGPRASRPPPGRGSRRFDARGIPSGGSRWRTASVQVPGLGGPAHGGELRDPGRGGVGDGRRPCGTPSERGA